jgi:hypothetical protein
MKFVKLDGIYGETRWVTNVGGEILEVVEQDELKYISKEVAEQIGAKDGDCLDNYDLNEIKYEYQSTLMEGIIDIDSLDDDVLYFDNWYEYFYTADDIRDWETKKVVYDFDGSNYRVKEILAEVEILDGEIEEIEIINKNTGIEKRYNYNGKEIIVDVSFYQGSWDTVEAGDEVLEELSTQNM